MQEEWSKRITWPAGSICGSHSSATGPPGPCATLDVAGGQNLLDIVVRPRDDVHRHEVAHALGCRRSGIGRRLHGPDVSSDHYGDITAADLFFADQADARSLDHGVGRFDRANESARFHHAERRSVVFCHKASKMSD